MICVILFQVRYKESYYYVRVHHLSYVSYKKQYYQQEKVHREQFRMIIM